MRKPVVYQETPAGRRVIEAKYSLTGPQQIAFQVARYDRSRPLVVDPVLDYASYLGGSGSEAAMAVAIDAAGNAFVAGVSDPTPGGAYISTDRVNSFVARINPGGSALVYMTNLGGGRDDRANAIALDVQDNAYLIGVTYSPAFPPGTHFSRAPLWRFFTARAMAARPGNRGTAAFAWPPPYC